MIEAAEVAEVVDIPTTGPKLSDEEICKQCAAVVNDALDRYECMIDVDVLVNRTGIRSFPRIIRRNKDVSGPEDVHDVQD